MKSLREILYPYYFRFVYLGKLRRVRNRSIRSIKKKGKARILFIVSNLAMWRTQKLFDMLSNDNQFEVFIILASFAHFDSDQKSNNLKELRQFFSERGISFLEADSLTSPANYVRETLIPDIIFYPQQYQSLYNNGLDSELYDTYLLCYVPYALIVFDQGWLYNQRFNNVAWRLYFPSDLHKINARNRAINKGANVRLVGEAISDLYLEREHKDSWKKHIGKKKRIIWAPHFSIEEGGWLHRGSFLILNQVMLNLADKYKDQVQFAFKPHPRLLTELYNSPQWGKEKADAYYQKWAQMPNTQLETGSYVDLFMTSDAMIHDCGSFTAEYHYTQNPVMFFTRDLDGVKKQLNELGLAAIEAHYIGGSAEDIESFIESVVLKGEDPLKPARKAVFDKYLLPPNGRSAAENIYHDLKSSLGFEK